MKQQTLLCRLPGGTDRSSLLDFQFESAPSVLGSKYLNTISPNTDVAYKIPIRNVLRKLKYNISPPGQGVRLPLRVGCQVAITIKLIRTWRGLELKTISLRVRGLDYPSTALSPYCLTWGWYAVIVWS